jgi:outer membrane protein TolC
MAAVLHAQATPADTLTLAQAEAIALKNHPQVAAALNEAAAAGQRVTEAKSAYYPRLTARSPRRKPSTTAGWGRAS